MEELQLDQLQRLLNGCQGVRVKGYRSFRGEWFPDVSERERKLHKLAETYHQECDVYDRQVCTGPVSHRSHIALPATPEENGMINKHAHQVHERIVDEGWMRHRFTRDEVEHAIHELSKLLGNQGEITK